MKRRNREVVLTVLAGLLLGVLTPMAWAQAPSSKLPLMIGISTYDVGASAYIQAGAVADIMMKKLGIQTRVVPSGNDISRTLTLKNKVVNFCFAGVATYYFAEEGLYDFATPEWGPQKVQAVWNCFPVGGSSMVTAKDAGIKTPYDLKGKRMFWIAGSPAMNVTNTAFLAFANLTWNDVKKVEYPSFGAAAKGMVEGSCDAGFNTATNPTLYELEASRRGIWWPEFPPTDKEGWKRLQAVAPYMFPMRNQGGAGQPPEGVQTMSYSYPLPLAYDWQDEELVYQFCKIVDENYEDLVKVTVAFKGWERKKAIMSGFSLPYHKGAVRYFKEKGIWNQEYESWQKTRIEKQNRLAAAWSAATAEAAQKGLKGEEFSKFWLKKHDEAVKGF
jgi:uncharacterized protein